MPAVAVDVEQFSISFSMPSRPVSVAVPIRSDHRLVA